MSSSSLEEDHHVSSQTMETSRGKTQSNTERDKKAFELCHGLITIGGTKLVVYFKNGADSGRGCLWYFGLKYFGLLACCGTHLCFYAL